MADLTRSVFGATERNMTDYDVAIVGAGPAGSATAAFLSERGFSVALIDRARFPRSKPCGEYVSPEARRILDHLLGPTALTREDANLLDGMRVVSPDGTSFTGRFRGRHQFRGYADCGIAVPRSILDLHLVRLAQRKGATLIEQATLRRLDAPTGGCRALHLRRTRRPTVLTSRLVVGADGLHSRVGRQLGVVRRGRLNRVAFVAHASGVVAMQSVGEMHVTHEGYVGLAPVGHGTTNVSVVVDTTRIDRRLKPPQWFQHMVDALPEVRQRMAHAEYVTPVRGVGPFARTSTRATADRAVLVGDAADFYDPFTGEGIYAALRGAELIDSVVAPMLECDQLDAGHLRVYDRARRREFAGKWLVERIISWTVGHSSVLNHVARRLRSKPDLADLLVGVTGNFVPARRVLRPGFTLQLVF